VSLFFRAAYLVGLKPWDSSVMPPELVAVVEGDGHLPPGRFLDVGCGPGSNSIYMAEKGWDVTGVDFVPRAIAMARRKLAAGDVKAGFLVGDVTRLGELGLEPGFDFVFDKGCFHSIPDELRDAYVSSVTPLARPGATMLMFCFVRGDKPSRVGPRGVDRTEVARRFASGWEMVSETNGPGFGRLGAAWYRLLRLQV